MGLNWLVTGGCGFIGTNLVKKLQESGVESIRVLDNLSVGTAEDLASVCEFRQFSGTDRYSFSPGVALIQGDILDAELVKRVAVGADVIVHLAGNTGVAPSVEDPSSDCMANVVGTLNMLEAGRACKVGRFIYASSGAPAGNATPPIHEEIVPHPVSPYGASKLACEGYCSAYFHSFGLQTVVLRFSNVYGPGSVHKHSVVASFIKRALEGKTLEIFGDGSQTRDFIFVDDLVEAIISAAAVESVGGELFQVATSRETNVAEIASALLDVLEEKGLGRVAIKNEQFRTGDVQRNYADTSKARETLGWKASVNLEEGLDKTIDYFRELKKE